MNHVIGESELQIVINALYTAAEKYRECARTVREEMPHASQLAEQFDRQVSDVVTLIEKWDA